MQGSLVAGAAVLAVLAGLAAFAMVDGGASAGPAPTSPGCSGEVPRITESTEFTAFRLQRSSVSTSELGARLLAEVTPVQDGEAPGVAPNDVSGEALVGLVESSSGMVTSLFGRHAWAELTKSADLGAFYRAGGLMLVTLPAGPEDDVGPDTVRDDPTRSIPVPVGAATAAVSWADPIDEAGLRPHVLQWTSGNENLRLIAERRPEDLVLAARALECRP